VTIDPHKLGYIPYPAGIVAFRDAQMTRLFSQETPYIGQRGDEVGVEADRPLLENVGPFSLEGSRPGAAAAACWLAHRTIPLDAQGHGRLMRSTIMGARRLAAYLELHQQMYFDLESECESPAAGEPFTFQVLAPPDTNLVCFVVRAMRSDGGKLRPADMTLAERNAFTDFVHRQMARPPGRAGTATPHAHPYFVSRSDLKPDRYPVRGLEPTLARLGIEPAAYADGSISFLRSTVMNPHYRLAAGRAGGHDYLLDYVRHLHRVARTFTPR
jgi:glutamate/tyrosine decarboxylase-like PLP-dependent enzyme